MLVDRLYTQTPRLDLLDPATLRLYSGHPERLQELVYGNPKKTQIIIDEVQKIPSLLDVVHRLIKKNPKIQFILTVSNARKLKRTSANLLAGRAVIRSLHPFMACELADQFNLDKALMLGLVPLIWRAQNSQNVLSPTYANSPPK